MFRDIRYGVVVDEIGLRLIRPKIFFSLRDGDLTLQAEETRRLPTLTVRSPQSICWRLPEDFRGRLCTLA
jgi:hypothetical protein